SGTDHVGFQHLRDTKEPCRSTRRRIAPAHARAIDGRFVAKFGFGARSWPDEKKAGNGTTTSARRAAHRLLLFAQFHFSLRKGHSHSLKHPSVAKLATSPRTLRVDAHEAALNRAWLARPFAASAARAACRVHSLPKAARHDQPGWMRGERGRGRSGTFTCSFEAASGQASAESKTPHRPSTRQHDARPIVQRGPGSTRAPVRGCPQSCYFHRRQCFQPAPRRRLTARIPAAKSALRKNAARLSGVGRIIPRRSSSITATPHAPPRRRHLRSCLSPRLSLGSGQVSAN